MSYFTNNFMMAKNKKIIEKRRVEVVKLQEWKRPDDESYFSVTVPEWIVKKTLLAKGGDKLKWDHKGAEAILRCVE